MHYQAQQQEQTNPTTKIQTQQTEGTLNQYLGDHSVSSTDKISKKSTLLNSMNLDSTDSKTVSTIDNNTQNAKVVHDAFDILDAAGILTQENRAAI